MEWNRKYQSTFQGVMVNIVSLSCCMHVVSHDMKCAPYQMNFAHARNAIAEGTCVFPLRMSQEEQRLLGELLHPEWC